MSGFLVPPTFAIDATAATGSTQNFVTPTTSELKPIANSVSVQLGTNDTMRAGRRFELDAKARCRLLFASSLPSSRLRHFALRWMIFVERAAIAVVRFSEPLSGAGCALSRLEHLLAADSGGRYAR